MPSKAARELAEKLLRDESVHYFSNGQFKYCPSEAAKLIQSAMADLLEKADEISCCFPAVEALRSHDCNHLETKLNADRIALAKALEPWREKTDDTPNKSA